MKSLSDLKMKLRRQIIEDKFLLSKNMITNLKIDLANVFKKYTNLKNEDININIKILASANYVIETSVEVNKIFL